MMNPVQKTQKHQFDHDIAKLKKNLGIGKPLLYPPELQGHGPKTNIVHISDKTSGYEITNTKYAGPL
jgi:hypothetical protein